MRWLAVAASIWHLSSSLIAFMIAVEALNRSNCDRAMDFLFVVILNDWGSSVRWLQKIEENERGTRRMFVNFAGIKAMMR